MVLPLLASHVASGGDVSHALKRTRGAIRKFSRHGLQSLLVVGNRLLTPTATHRTATPIPPASTHLTDAKSPISSDDSDDSDDSEVSIDISTPPPPSTSPSNLLIDAYGAPPSSPLIHEALLFGLPVPDAKFSIDNTSYSARFDSPESNEDAPPTPTQRMTILLDLDETLVHSIVDPCCEAFPESDNHDFDYLLRSGDRVRVFKRPGLEKFLEFVRQSDAEFFVFTASLAEYASPLLDILDPNDDIFAGRYYRDATIFRKGVYLKDLARLGFSLDRVCLVDNNPLSFICNPDNACPISSFLDDQNDRALAHLEAFLSGLVTLADVRPYLRNRFLMQAQLNATVAVLSNRLPTS